MEYFYKLIATNEMALIQINCSYWVSTANVLSKLSHLPEQTAVIERNGQRQLPNEDSVKTLRDISIVFENSSPKGGKNFKKIQSIAFKRQTFWFCCTCCTGLRFVKLIRGFRGQ